MLRYHPLEESHWKQVLGWGVDVAVVLVAVAALYIGKKFVDKWFSKES